MFSFQSKITRLPTEVTMTHNQTKLEPKQIISIIETPSINVLKALKENRNRHNNVKN